MPVRLRRAVAAFGVVVFLVVYVWGVVELADRLPDSPWVKLLVFGLAGVAWGLPILPLITWGNRGPRR